MKCTLEEITVNSDRVYQQLMKYLDKLSAYPNFDRNMMFRLFINDDKDFTALEAVDYRVEFTSLDHKLIETIRSGKSVDPVSFTELYRHLTKIRR